MIYSKKKKLNTIYICAVVVESVFTNTCKRTRIFVLGICLSDKTEVGDRMIFFFFLFSISNTELGGGPVEWLKLIWFWLNCFALRKVNAAAGRRVVLYSVRFCCRRFNCSCTIRAAVLKSWRCLFVMRFFLGNIVFRYNNDGRCPGALICFMVTFCGLQCGTARCDALCSPLQGGIRTVGTRDDS